MSNVVEQAKEEETSKSAVVADDDLDALLNEYEGENDGDKTADKSQKSGDIKSQLERFMQRQTEREERELRQRASEDAQKGEAEAVEIVKEVFKSEGFDVPERLVSMLLNDEARQDERFLKAFQDRHNSPSKWKTILTKRARDWESLVEKYKADTSENDRKTASIAAQSRGNKKTGDSSAADYAKEVSQMSDREFLRHKRQLLGR